LFIYFTYYSTQDLFSPQSFSTQTTHRRPVSSQIDKSTTFQFFYMLDIRACVFAEKVHFNNLMCVRPFTLIVYHHLAKYIFAKLKNKNFGSLITSRANWFPMPRVWADIGIKLDGTVMHDIVQYL